MGEKVRLDIGIKTTGQFSSSKMARKTIMPWMQKDPSTFHIALAISGVLILLFGGFGLMYLASKNEATRSPTSTEEGSNSSQKIDMSPEKAAPKKTRKASNPFRTFHWAFNPALGCNRQDHTPAELVKKQKDCKATIIPNPSKKLVLVRCKIAEGANLDYVFTESQEVCLWAQSAAMQSRE
jgi:hypothetical protein